MFKCMSGFTTEKGKFIMPLQEKLSYSSSFDRCDSLGFRNNLYGLIRLKFILIESITLSVHLNFFLGPIKRVTEAFKNERVT